MTSRFPASRRASALAVAVLASLVVGVPAVDAGSTSAAATKACTHRKATSKLTAKDVKFLRDYTLCLVKRARKEAHAGLGTRDKINALAKSALDFGVHLNGGDALDQTKQKIVDGLADETAACEFTMYVDDTHTNAKTPLAVAKLIATLAKNRDAGALTDPRADTAVATQSGRFGEGRTSGDVALMILNVACIGA